MAKLITRDEALRHFSSEYYREKYLNERVRAEHLFPSERRFLEQVLKPGMAVLDVGCACGGTFAMLRELCSPLRYTGVDIARPLLDVARRLYPEAVFIEADATEPGSLPHGPFELVVSFGVTVHEPRYPSLLANAYDATDRYLLYDIHLHAGGAETSDIDSAYVVNASGLRNHYIVTPVDDAVAFATRLRPRPKKVEMFGYLSPVSRGKRVVLPGDPSDVCTAAVLVERGDEETHETEVSLELPPELGELNGAAAGVPRTA